MSEQEFIDLAKALENRILELEATVAQQAETIYRLRLADALDRWRQPRKKGGRAKSVNKDVDLELLALVLDFQKKRNIKYRRNALYELLKISNDLRKDQGRQVRNDTQIKQEIKTLENRFAAAKKSAANVRPEN